MRLALTGRVAIVLIFAGGVLLSYSIRCLAPHPRVALDIPISLSPGHVSITDFGVEPDTLYHIDVILSPTDHTPVDCQPYTVLNTKWTLKGGGQVEEGSSPWEDSGLTIADMLGGDGRYTFDMTILPGAACLNARSPRLRVQTHVHPSDLYSVLNWFSIWMNATGFFLLIHLWAGQAFRRQPAPRIFPEMALRNVLRLQRHSSTPWNPLPNYGVGWVWSALLVVVVFEMAGNHRREYGLMVNLKYGDAPAWQRTAWTETLSVYVDGRDRFYLNGRPVPQQDLRMRLNDELEKRANWAVYFEADDNCTYANAVFAIDTIQGLGAKVIWLTPRVREQLSKGSK